MDKKPPLLAADIKSKCLLCGGVVYYSVRCSTFGNPQFWMEAGSVVLTVQGHYTDRLDRWPKGAFSKREMFAVCRKCVPVLRARGFKAPEHYKTRY